MKVWATQLTHFYSTRYHQFGLPFWKALWVFAHLAPSDQVRLVWNWESEMSCSAKLHAQNVFFELIVCTRLKAFELVEGHKNRRKINQQLYSFVTCDPLKWTLFMIVAYWQDCAQDAFYYSCLILMKTVDAFLDNWLFLRGFQSKIFQNLLSASMTLILFQVHTLGHYWRDQIANYTSFFLKWFFVIWLNSNCVW